jgi:hypothetical protein
MGAIRLALTVVAILAARPFDCHPRSEFHNNGVKTARKALTPTAGRSALVIRAERDTRRPRIIAPANSRNRRMS